MKNKNSIITKNLLLSFFLVILLFPSCKTENSSKPTIICDSYFWGHWVRMDNGKQYEILEDKILFENSEYAIISSNKTEIKAAGLGKFQKESDRIIINNNIPYFRDGGANLEYSLKFVGFANDYGRISASGIKGKATSTKYKSYEQLSESNPEGIITFNAPSPEDIQTVTIENGSELIVVPGLQIINNGDSLGTVALVNKNDYNLKITGTISENQKNDRYLYCNKEYIMDLKITNISKNPCKSAVCSITSLSPNLTISTNENLSGSLDVFQIPTMKEGATFNIQLSIECNEITEPYINTGIKITILDNKGRQWEDFVPLRFYKGLIPVTISARSTLENPRAQLNGFIIYPDGNNQFFTVKNYSSKTLMVPSFTNTEKYILVFSGAETNQTLSDSTEMYYSVAPGISTAKEIDMSEFNSIEKMYECITFGGNNHTEYTAFNVDEPFIGYLEDGEIDFFQFSSYSNEYYSPEVLREFEFLDNDKFISYENDTKTLTFDFSSENVKNIAESLKQYNEYRDGVLNIPEQIEERKIETIVFKGNQKTFNDLCIKLNDWSTTSTATIIFNNFSFSSSANKPLIEASNNLTIKYFGQNRLTSLTRNQIELISNPNFKIEIKANNNSSFIIKPNTPTSSTDGSIGIVAKEVIIDGGNFTIEGADGANNSGGNGSSGIKADKTIFKNRTVVNITAGAGATGRYFSYSNGRKGGDGGYGISGDVSVESGEIIITGGNGGNGSDGAHGDNGSTGRNRDVWNFMTWNTAENGSNGTDGFSGGNGGNGGSAIVGNLEMLVGSITLSGGDGGKGGTGGNGGDGGQGGEDSAIEWFGKHGSGNGGDGGKAGDGGKGGDGANSITGDFDTSRQNIERHFGESGSGGSAGIRGNRGSPGESGDRGRWGEYGKPGIDGERGQSGTK
ncbi:MAG: collagen-like protein [Treponema sp.]|nr:collagen-like protein [Treponema sp.]